MASLRQGEPDAGIGFEIDEIAAVVIGGTSLMGDRGAIVGTLVRDLVFWVSEQYFASQQYQQQHPASLEGDHPCCGGSSSIRPFRRNSRLAKKIASLYLKQFLDRIDVSNHLSVLDGDQILAIAKMDASKTYGLSLQVSFRRIGP